MTNPASDQPERVPRARSTTIEHRLVGAPRLSDRRTGRGIVPDVRHRPVVRSWAGSASRARSPPVSGPNRLVELPAGGHEHQRRARTSARDTRRSPLDRGRRTRDSASCESARLRLGRHVLGDGGHDLLAVGLQRVVLVVVLQVDGELVDAEVLQLAAAARCARSTGPRMQKRSTISSGTNSVWVLPAWPCSL